MTNVIVQILVKDMCEVIKGIYYCYSVYPREKSIQVCVGACVGAEGERVCVCGMSGCVCRI